MKTTNRHIITFEVNRRFAPMVRDRAAEAIARSGNVTKIAGHTSGSLVEVDALVVIEVEGAERDVQVLASRIAKDPALHIDGLSVNAADVAASLEPGFTTDVTRNRETGTLIALFQYDGRVFLQCEEHDHSREFSNLTKALRARSHPSEWCSNCAKVKVAKAHRAAPKPSGRLEHFERLMSLNF